MSLLKNVINLITFLFGIHLELCFVVTQHVLLSCVQPNYLTCTSKSFMLENIIMLYSCLSVYEIHHAKLNFLIKLFNYLFVFR